MIRRIDGVAKVRLAGTSFVHTIRVRVETQTSYVDLFGVQIGRFSFYWTNPWAGD